MKDIPPPTTNLTWTHFHNVDPEQVLSSDRIQERDEFNASVTVSNSLQYLRPIFATCAPCDVEYTYIVKMETLHEDMRFGWTDISLIDSDTVSCPISFLT